MTSARDSIYIYGNAVTLEVLYRVSDEWENMLGRASDPALLFTPESPALSEISDISRSPFPRESRPSRGFYISIPSLPHSEKEKYNGLSESTLTNDVGFDFGDVDQVIGEYMEKDTLYYFARFQDGITHKVRVLCPVRCDTISF